MLNARTGILAGNTMVMFGFNNEPLDSLRYGIKVFIDSNKHITHNFNLVIESLNLVIESLNLVFYLKSVILQTLAVRRARRSIEYTAIIARI